MLHTHLETFASWAPEKPFLVTEDGIYRYEDALAIGNKLAARLEFLGFDRFGVLLPEDAERILVLLGAAAAGSTVCLLDPEQSDSELLSQIEQLGLDGLIVADETRLSANAITYTELLQTTPSGDWTAAKPDTSRCLILTRGRTRQPRGTEYLWQDLLAQGEFGEKTENGRWLLGHPMHEFWGMLTLMRVITNAGALLIPRTRDPVTLAKLAEDRQATHIATTPGVWDELLDPCKDLPLQCIELSGDAAREEILIRTREQLPDTQMRQHYGTTELGVCFTVADWTEGFRCEVLNQSEPAIRICDGRLEARCDHGMRNFVGDRRDRRGRWQSTGDLVIQTGERIHFAGRTRPDVRSTRGYGQETVTTR